MREKLNLLRKSRFLEVNSWAGLSNMPGTNGFIITSNKLIYYYHSYRRIPDYLKDEVPLEFISNGERISDDVYMKLVRYINQKIVGKSFKDISIFDAGCSVSGKGFNVTNHYKVYNDLRKIIGG